MEDHADYTETLDGAHFKQHSGGRISLPAGGSWVRAASAPPNEEELPEQVEVEDNEPSETVVSEQDAQAEGAESAEAHSGDSSGDSGGDGGGGDGGGDGGGGDGGGDGGGGDGGGGGGGGGGD